MSKPTINIALARAIDVLNGYTHSAGPECPFWMTNHHSDAEAASVLKEFMERREKQQSRKSKVEAA